MAQSLGTATLRQGGSRKLSKIPERRTTSMDLPERFRVDEDEEEEEDAAQGDEDNPETFVQQSMYGIIAAAHSTGNFKPALQPLSGSESDSEGEGSKRASKDISWTVSGESSEISSADEKQAREKRPGGNRHRRHVSDSIRSFLKPIRERGDSQSQDVMSQSQFLPPKESVAEETDRPITAIRRDAPLMDRKLQARARANMDSSPYSSHRRSRESSPPQSSVRRKAPVALPEALAEIFQFDEPEEVISEYACWYLQSVLLQGYMYITQKHVCFYAYLQKKGNVVKSGHLAKQGKRNPRYRRYWFTLKGDVLSYYASAAEPYFPSGTIDLRYAISAEVAPEKDQEKGKESGRFTITTENRTYYFRADSPSSAKEWVRQLQKVIFRSHNDGDSVKISLPLENIVDVEPNPVMDLAETVKIRVVDSEQTFAIDEYFFSFFNHGKDALNVLTLMTQDNDAKKAAAEMTEDAPPVKKSKTPPPFRRSLSLDKTTRFSIGAGPAIAESVRSTLSPMSTGDRISPRISSEQARSSAEMTRPSLDRGRSSFDRGQRSVSTTSRSVEKWRVPSKSPLSRSAQESSESFVTSEHQDDSQDGGVEDMSASQMLSGDRAFHGPTLKMPQPRQTASGTTVERLRQESRDVSPQSPAENITIQAPTRRQTDDNLTASPTEIDNARSEYFVKPMAKDAKSQTYDSLTSTSRAKKSLASPLQHAFNLADAVRNQSKRMSSYLSSSPKSYYDKFSDAIAGGKRHYSETEGLAPDDRIPDTEDEDTQDHERRFQQHFALPETERLRAVYYCWLHRVLPLYGKIYISDRRFCFRSLIYGTRTKLVVPFRDILNVDKEKGFRWGYPGMVVVIRGHEELFFDFGSVGVRDDCAVTVLRALDVVKSALDSIILTAEEKTYADEAAAENEMLLDARKETLVEHEHRPDPQLVGSPPILFDDPNASVLDFRPKKSLNITCLTIGSRGDVQPYIALCKGLIGHGHHAKIATHAQFEGWIRKYGIDFAPVEGDPAELMRLCVENGMFTPSFVVEASGSARDWLDKLLNSAWQACQGADILIESPSAMAGVHIAEALGIPYFRAFTMPWTKTRAYPHAFAVPKTKQGGAYNYMTYLFFDNIFWQLTANQINRWRKKTLRLRSTDLSKLQLNKVPFLYNFSPSVVVPPLDFSDWIRVTGYWFLDEGAQDWSPPADLQAFIKKARDDRMKIVYVGFGSIPVSDSKQLTQQIVDAVLKADVRCIFSKGWSDHFDKTDPNASALPDAIYQVRAVPHDWLFTQIDAAVHHGGAGTTGASLRAGLPTVIKPFFGDQFFFATRVEDLGVGVYLKKITVNALGKAIWLATHDARMRTKAHMLGEQIRQENGVENAINAIYRDLEYAKTLIKKRKTPIAGAADEEDDTEESWTFVETDSDVDVTGARNDFNGHVQGSKRLSLGSMVLRGRIT